MAKPTSTGALKTRLSALYTEVGELQQGATTLNQASAAGVSADGYARVLREVRKVLDRAADQGYLTKL